MSDERKILIVDDEASIRKFLRVALVQAGFKIIEAEGGAEGIAHTASYNPDLILLDIGLPDIDGFTVIERLREWSRIPIIVLSARGKEEEKVRALDLGANDYLTKPFGVKELLARVRVALRLRDGEAEPMPPTFTAGELQIDFAKRIVMVKGAEVHLTPIEFNLLALLVRHAGKVLTHKQLLSEIWGPAYSRQPQYLRVFVNQLRQKVEPEPARPRLIVTEPGVGYRFKSSSD